MFSFPNLCHTLPFPFCHNLLLKVSLFPCAIVDSIVRLYFLISSHFIRFPFSLSIRIQLSYTSFDRCIKYHVTDVCVNLTVNLHYSIDIAFLIKFSMQFICCTYCILRIPCSSHMKPIRLSSSPNVDLDILCPFPFWYH